MQSRWMKGRMDEVLLESINQQTHSFVSLSFLHLSEFFHSSLQIFSFLQMKFKRRNLIWRKKTSSYSSLLFVINVSSIESLDGKEEEARKKGALPSEDHKMSRKIFFLWSKSGPECSLDRQREKRDVTSSSPSCSIWTGESSSSGGGQILQADPSCLISRHEFIRRNNNIIFILFLFLRMKSTDIKHHPINSSV